MTFPHAELLTVIALQHQRDLIEEANDRRLVRQARQIHPSRRWRRRSPQVPPAA